jgi:hypothetical protein
MKPADALAVRRGAVVRSSGSECLVELEGERCADCTGACGIAVGGRAPIRVARSVWPGGTAPAPGTTVWFSVPRRRFTGAVALTFGAPLLGLVAGAALATGLHGADASVSSAGWMLAGLAIGGAVPLWAQRVGMRRDSPSGLELQVFFGERAPDRSRVRVIAPPDTEGSNR